jgi:starvation-inducible DNA-binding protein
MESLIEILRTLQANAFIYYTKAHGYHWNVEGILFDQFHEFFSDIYNDAWSSIDGYAEWIRIFGEKAIFDTPSILMGSNIKYDLDSTANSPIDMLLSLNASNDRIILDLKEAFNIANASGEQGVANFFADRITAHEKFRWKITASLKTMGNN